MKGKRWWHSHALKDKGLRAILHSHAHMDQHSDWAHGEDEEPGDVYWGPFPEQSASPPPVKRSRRKPNNAAHFTVSAPYSADQPEKVRRGRG